MLWGKIPGDSLALRSANIEMLGGKATFCLRCLQLKSPMDMVTKDTLALAGSSPGYQC